MHNNLINTLTLPCCVSEPLSSSIAASLSGDVPQPESVEGAGERGAQSSEELLWLRRLSSVSTATQVRLSKSLSWREGGGDRDGESYEQRREPSPEGIQSRIFHPC